MNSNNLPHFCSGYGQHHSPNNKKSPREYTRVTLNEIAEMAENPPSVPKNDAPWVIPSTLLSRVHAEQEEMGLFGALCGEGDEMNGSTFKNFVSLSVKILRSNVLAYTTKNATEDNQRVRFFVPLQKLVSGKEFVILQKILNDKFEENGIALDRGTERAGQLNYLPNPGGFYRSSYISFIALFDPSVWDAEVEQIKKEQKAEQQEKAAKREEARQKAAKRMADGMISPIDAFNAEYDLPLILEDCGYIQHRNRWLSPNSESGTPGVTITDDGEKWLSAHGSDANIGRPTKNGTMGDAFDLFVFYEHDNDYNAALKAAGAMFTVDGVTITKYNQIEYMANKAQEEALASLKRMGNNTGDLLVQFALNGKSAAMEKKMLDDKFILDKLAILGQSTLFYAKPNVGKTLLIIWLLIKSIKAGIIKGEDVFFINADDNHKGLTYKLKLAEQHGFNMLAPGYENFKAEMLTVLLQKLIEVDEARGKILILDTVKKFTDIMRKDKASEFGENVRQFVSHGGSVIMLAHTNKHRGDDDKVIFAGTSDLVDDADCAFLLDIVAEDKFAGPRTVKFENFKNRGDVAIEATYEYSCSPGMHYNNRLDSVRSLTDDEREKAARQDDLERGYVKNKEIIEAISQVLKSEPMNKTELVRSVMTASGFSRRNIIRTLDEHEGINLRAYKFWNAENEDKNTTIYTSNERD